VFDVGCSYLVWSAYWFLELTSEFLLVPHPRRPSHHSFLQISVRDGNFDDLDGLDPTIKWEDSSSSGQADLSYGIEAAVRPTTDIASLPRSIWGKVSTDVSGWGVSARADVEGADFGSADFEVDAANSVNDIAVKMVASAAGGFNVRVSRLPRVWISMALA
jgi:hypothetical protein